MKRFITRYYNDDSAVRLVYLDKSVRLPNGSWTIRASLRGASSLTVTLPLSIENAGRFIVVDAVDLGRYGTTDGKITVITDGRDTKQYEYLLSAVGDYVYFFSSGDRWWAMPSYIAP